MERAGYPTNRFIHRYGVAIFFVLAVALGGGVVVLVGMEFLPAGFAMVSAMSASAAGVIMTGIEDGRAGLKLLLRWLLIWRVGVGYWLFAGLFIIPAFLIGSVANPLFNGDPLLAKNMLPVSWIIPFFIGFFIAAGLGQELGWTGYLLPRLQARCSALVACIIRTILVSLWHLPLLVFSYFRPQLFPDMPYPGWIAQRGFLAAFGVMALLFELPWAVFYAWIFNNTKGSLLLVAVLHSSEAWVAYWMLSAGINPQNIDNYWGYGVFLILAALVISITTGRKNLSRQHSRIIYQPTPV